MFGKLSTGFFALNFVLSFYPAKINGRINFDDLSREGESTLTEVKKNVEKPKSLHTWRCFAEGIFLLLLDSLIGWLKFMYNERITKQTITMYTVSFLQEER